MLFEVAADINQRLAQLRLFTEHQRNQQASESTIAVSKRVDGLELIMDQRETNQARQDRVFLVQISLKGVQTLIEKLWRRGDKLRGRKGLTRANRVLGGAEFTGLDPRPLHAIEQDPVHLSDQPKADR